MSSQALELAQHFNELNQFERVLEHLSHAISDYLADPSYWQLRAHALYVLDRLDEAHDAALNGLELEPEHINLLLFYARIQANQGKLEEAELSFQKLLDLAPDDPVILSSYARYLMTQISFFAIFIKTKRRTKVKSLLDRALELDPHHKLALESQLILAQRIDNKAAIKRYTQRLLQQDPDDASAHAALGELNLEKQRLLSASRHFGAAAHTDPENKTITQKARAHRIPEHPLLPAWLFNNMHGVYTIVALIAISWTALLFLDVFPKPRHAFLAFGLPYGCFALYYALTPPIIKRYLRRQRD